MNKNLNNLDGKGTQGGQMHNKGYRENETRHSEGGINPNNDKRIYPVETSVEKNRNREVETHSREWKPNLNKEKDRLDSSAEVNRMKEKEPIVKGSGTIQNKNTVDGSPSSRTQAMYNREPVSKSSTFQSITQNQNRADKQLDDLNAPVITGTALYVIAALLLIGWAVGFFFFNAGPIINVLLILALISVLFKVLQGKVD